MSSNSKVSLDEVKWLVWLFLGWTYWLAARRAPQETPYPKPPVRCGKCGGQMQVVRVSFQPITVLPAHAVSYLDSG